jgi:DNA-binding phage protein
LEEIKMVKIKTSKKPKKFSKNIVKIKPNAPIIEYSPLEEVLNSDLVAKAILDALKNGDHEGVMEAISTYLYTVNIAKTAKAANLSRSTLYHNLKHKNPTIKTLAKIVHASTLEEKNFKNK